MRIHLCTYYLPAKVTHNQDPSKTHDGQQGNQGVVALQTLTGHALEEIKFGSALDTYFKKFRIERDILESIALDCREVPG